MPFGKILPSCSCTFWTTKPPRSPQQEREAGGRQRQLVALVQASPGPSVHHPWAKWSSKKTELQSKLGTVENNNGNFDHGLWHVSSELRALLGRKSFQTPCMFSWQANIRWRSQLTVIDLCASIFAPGDLSFGK